jgi:chemotaxis signal transduction protein
MAIFLQVRASGLHLMLDALHVHEVLGQEPAGEGSRTHVQWRNDVLAAIDVARLLGVEPGQPGMGVVYSPDEGPLPVMLLVDEVLGLKNLQAQDWNELPRIPTHSAQLFDKVWLEPEVQRQSLRLRHPLAATLFAVR